MGVNGFDPLELIGEANANELLLDRVRRRTVRGILKSYTGFYDVFSEAIQNALDEVQRKHLLRGADYSPKLWIAINLRDRIIRVVDNGRGMDDDKLKLCFAPHVSFKEGEELRGQKGVGATFLAYGYSFVKLQTKHNGETRAVVLRQGRQWAEDESGVIQRPKLEEVDYDVPELTDEEGGTALEIQVGNHPGERPRQLDWQGAQNAAQWHSVLRIATPLGGIYLGQAEFKPVVTVTVLDSRGITTEATESGAGYFYPHEIPGIRAKRLEDLRAKLDNIPGDAETKFRKIPDEFKRLQCIYEQWDKDRILDPTSSLRAGGGLTQEQQTLVERHDVTVYGAFVSGLKVWDEFNDNILNLREGYRILRGGLQMASDSMVQGELITIPLKRAIGYQHNTHVVVHFANGNPDLGRKSFQPEQRELAEFLATQAVECFKRYLSHLRSDTGGGAVTPDKELHEWRKRQEMWRDGHPLTLAGLWKSITVLSEPQEEQDVVALYHQLIGAGVIRGIHLFAATSNDRYDALFKYDYTDGEDWQFKTAGRPLGVSKYRVGDDSEPKVLEYKYDLDALIRDFQTERKFAKHVDLAVCWKASGDYRSMIELRSYLIGNEGEERTFFGATHAAYQIGGGREPVFEVVILEDLYRYLLDREGEEARQRTLYEL